MKHYHFSCGDSTKGTVGLCARVTAKNKRDALEKLKSALQDSVGWFDEIPVRIKRPGIEYVNVYISPRNVRLTHIEDVEVGADLR